MEPSPPFASLALDVAPEDTLEPHEWLGCIAAVAQKRDRKAFVRLFEHYGPRVKSFLCARGALPELAEEISQEVMLSVWRKAEQFDPERGSPGAWIFTIARNAFLNEARRKRPEADAADPETVVLADATALDDMTAFEARRAVAGAVAALPEDQALALEGAYFRGRTLRELAVEQGVPLGTMKTRVRLALARLRRAMVPGSAT